MRFERSLLLAMLASVIVFAAAVAFGALFAFPEPDAAPEQAARLHLHSSIAGTLMLVSILVFFGASAILGWRWIRKRAQRSANSVNG